MTFSPDSLLTGSAYVTLPTDGGRVLPDPSQDTALIAVFERHHATGASAIGFVRGLGIGSGALASTIAHDSHNLLVAGYDPDEMAQLANHLAENGGGIAVLNNGVIKHLPLRMGGLMSLDGIESVISRYKEVKEEALAMGSGLTNVFMAMSFLSLPVIPELKITDLGLVDVNKFDFVSMFD